MISAQLSVAIRSKTGFSVGHPGMTEVVFCNILSFGFSIDLVIQLCGHPAWSSSFVVIQVILVIQELVIQLVIQVGHPKPGHPDGHPELTDVDFKLQEASLYY